MSPNSNYINKTLAAGPIVGFDYQFYVYLLYLLKLEEGEEIGLEIEDDIHIRSNDKLLLIQAKHAIYTKDGKNKDFTDFDIDLWKTFSNWINYILIKYPDYVASKQKIELCMYANKTISTNIIKSIESFHSHNINFKQMKKIIKNIYDTTENKTIKKYIKNLLIQSDEWIRKFLTSIKFIYEDYVIARIKRAIKDKLVDDKDIQYIYDKLYAGEKDLFYNAVKERKHTIVTYDEYHKRALLYLDRHNKKLSIKQDHATITSTKTFEEDLFLKQLIDINDVDITDIGRLADYCANKMYADNNIKQWIKDNDIGNEDLKNFNKETCAKWDNIHHSFHKHNSNTYKKGDSDIHFNNKDCANKCIDEIRKINLKLLDTELDIRMSNGQFYLLSDNPDIGWIKGWDDKYKNEQ